VGHRVLWPNRSVLIGPRRCVRGLSLDRSACDMAMPGGWSAHAAPSMLAELRSRSAQCILFQMRFCTVHSWHSWHSNLSNCRCKPQLLPRCYPLFLVFGKVAAVWDTMHVNDVGWELSSPCPVPTPRAPAVASKEHSAKSSRVTADLV
jgi:hypothetical protein